MKYFAIESSLNEKIMGKIPQIKEFIHHCEISTTQNHIDNFVFKEIEVDPILSYVSLYASVKQTDIIDAYGHVGFDFSYIISNKFKTILDNFNCYGYQFFKTHVVYKNKKIENYWQIKKFDFPYHFIDFEKSNFILKDRDLNRNVISETIQFKNIDEFNLFTSKINYPKMISFKDVFFTEEMDLDFFSLRYTEGGHKGIVSERLKNELEKNEISGIEFRPIEINLQEWLQGGERAKAYGKT